MAWTHDAVARLLEPIPHAPGIYLMRDGEGRIVYIGKAVDLQARVRQYFQASGDPRPFVALLSGILDRIDTVVTTNEKEALILENELIKKHRPPFNILLKDDKTYLYLRLDAAGEAFPRLELVRRRRADRAMYFGPYASAASVRRTHALVNRHFGLRTCEDREFANRSRPCLEHQVGRCPAPCVGKATEEEYRGRVEAVALFLRGRYEEVRRRLAARMGEAAEAENFEEAARLRDQVRAIETALTRQAVVLPDVKDTDAWGVARSGESVAFAVLRFEGGVLSERVPLLLDGVKAPVEEVADSVLLQYYGRAPVPAVVRVPAEAGVGAAALAEVLAARSGHAVSVKAASRGAGADALRVAAENARQLLEEHLAKGEVRERATLRLQELLGLPRPPRRIEGVDLSTFQGGQPVGSLVVFQDGRPDKRAWRTFAVRLEEGPGDVGFLREVLKRRLQRARDGEQPLPDLLMIDGGGPQVRAARAVLAEAGVDLPLVGLAKARVTDGGHGPARHSPERLVVPAGGAAGTADGCGGAGSGGAGGPALQGAAEAAGTGGREADARRGSVREPDVGRGGLREADARRGGLREPDVGRGPLAPPDGEVAGRDPLAPPGSPPDLATLVPAQNDPGLHLLMRVRDEAHRFAVRFHRKRRGDRERGSLLDGIPGLGKVRRVALLRHFGSVAALRAASLETLRAVPGLPGPVAEAIFEKVHG